MNIAANPAIEADQTIYLKDYQKPSYIVDSVELNIQVYADHTLVSATLVMQRQTEGELVLLGRDLELQSIHVNGKPLSESEYKLDTEQLVIGNAPDQATIETVVRIHPESNTQLEGLYQASSDLFVTQNEPEGFRKITFYPDRPDVLSVFTTRVEADKKFPVLLANGNLIETGEAGEGRHYAVWQDPTKKPSYLFACVIGDLAVMKDRYTTSEGRDVALEIYAEEKDIPKCKIAMEALKHSMRWDEEHYGRPYDLDNYMIVATSAFNMGAMENKGLNIFNTSCVLADEEFTTDAAIMRVQSVIAHEYFHNWTGNRITCRDWFQLCLKEGLTVFRDQSFSEDLQSAAVQRIDDVAVLKAHQFPEDSGPLSHSLIVCVSSPDKSLYRVLLRILILHTRVCTLKSVIRVIIRHLLVPVPILRDLVLVIYECEHSLFTAVQVPQVFIVSPVWRIFRGIQHHLFMVSPDKDTTVSHLLLKIAKEFKHLVDLRATVDRISKVDQSVAGSAGAFC